MNNRSFLTFSAAAALLLFCLPSSSCAEPAWRMTSENVVMLSAASDDLGRIVYRVYSRDAPRGTVDVIITEGSGTGPLRTVSTDEPDDNDGLFPADGDYSVTEVGGRTAVLERHPLLPASLAVSVGETAVMTLESSSASVEELAALAEQIMKD